MVLTLPKGIWSLTYLWAGRLTRTRKTRHTQTRTKVLARTEINYHERPVRAAASATRSLDSERHLMGEGHVSHPHSLDKRPGTRLRILLLIMLVSRGLGLYLSISSRPDVFNPTPIKFPRQFTDLTAPRLPGLIAARHHTGYMAFSPDGKTLGLPKGDDGRVELWNFETGREQVLVSPFKEGESTANNIAFSKDSRSLAGIQAPRGHYMGLGREKDLAFLPNTSHAFVHDMAFAGDDRILFRSWPNTPVGTKKPTSGIIRPSDGDLDGEELQTHVFDPFLRFKALSRDGRYAVMQKFMVGQTVFDLVTGKGIFTVVGSGEFVFSDDVSTLVSYDGDEAWVWNVPSGKQLKHFVFKPN